LKHNKCHNPIGHTYDTNTYMGYLIAFQSYGDEYKCDSITFTFNLECKKNFRCNYGKT